MSNREPVQPGQPDEDQWAEIVAAAGYDDSADAPIYTGRKDEAPPTADRWLSDPLLSSEAGPAARRQQEEIGDPMAAPYPAEPAPNPQAQVGGWNQPESWAEEDDVVLRAFEAHAQAEPAAPVPAAPPPFEPARPGDIDELLGFDGDNLVDEAMEAIVEGSRPVPAAHLAEPLPWEDPTPVRAPARLAAYLGDEGWDADDQPAGRYRDGDDTYIQHTEEFVASAVAPYGSAVPDASDTPLIEPTRMRSKKRHGRTVAREVVETLLLALLVFLAVRASFQNFKVDGNSMYPTLENGEFLIVNKLVYSEVDVEKLSRFLPFLDPGDTPKRFVFHGPQRGDIVVLHDPRQPGVDLIKRVVALPGETIEIVNGTIFINGYLLEEPYIEQAWHYTGPPTALGPNEYFVMGDNRDNSKDSRSIGPVTVDRIIGKALVTYWPAGDIGLAPNGKPHLTDRTVESYREEMGIAAVATTR
jgi:signal peptidase I